MTIQPAGGLPPKSCRLVIVIWTLWIGSACSPHNVPPSIALWASKPSPLTTPFRSPKSSGPFCKGSAQGRGVSFHPPSHFPWHSPCLRRASLSVSLQTRKGRSGPFLSSPPSRLLLSFPKGAGVVQHRHSPFGGAQGRSAQRNYRTRLCGQFLQNPKPFSAPLKFHHHQICCCVRGWVRWSERMWTRSELNKHHSGVTKTFKNLLQKAGAMWEKPARKFLRA